jgi:hypothetical protein
MDGEDRVRIVGSKPTFVHNIHDLTFHNSAYAIQVRPALAFHRARVHMFRPKKIIQRGDGHDSKAGHGERISPIGKKCFQRLTLTHSVRIRGSWNIAHY